MNQLVSEKPRVISLAECDGPGFEEELHVNEGVILETHDRCSSRPTRIVDTIQTCRFSPTPGKSILRLDIKCV